MKTMNRTRTAGKLERGPALRQISHDNFPPDKAPTRYLAGPLQDSLGDLASFSERDDALRHIEFARGRKAAYWALWAVDQAGGCVLLLVYQPGALDAHQLSVPVHHYYW